LEISYLENENMSNKFLIYIVPFLLLMGGGIFFQSSLYGESLSDRLVPGLRVFYFEGKYRNVGQVPNMDIAVSEKGRPGSIIPIINHQFGDNDVFDSGRNREVGVQINGYVLFDQKGSYEFQALSNDGIEVFIDGNSVLIDQDVHSDRLSEIGRLSVQKVGWHSLTVKYFQRKGTAAIKLFWKTPGMDAFDVIPAMAYGHLPDESSAK
jgi:hypothetical protein